MGQTRNDVFDKATSEYLKNIDPANPPSPADIEESLLTKLQEDISAVNTNLPKGMPQIPAPISLPPVVIAEVMMRLYHIRRLSFSDKCTDSDYDMLAIYQSEGEEAGTYTTREDEFRRIARLYDYSITINNFKEVLAALEDRAPRMCLCKDRDLIAVNNGIFNYRTKTLEPFTPDNVFVSKSHVDYNPNAVNPVIHDNSDGTDWDVESWMQSLSDDPEIVKFLWEMMGAAIRPNVNWDKSAWLYSEQGENGKGTLCALMRNLCGPGTHCSIALSDFSKDFMLEPLVKASAIITDENDVGSYIERSANLKAIITNDTIQINRKHKSPITYQFRGFMVQCLNEFPKIRDHSDSMYRRMIFVPMTKCFTGVAKRYIKSDYLQRKEVLEYVLKRILHSNYYELSEPLACSSIHEEYKEYNSTVRQFWNEMESSFEWDLLPYGFLYQLYRKWFEQNQSGGGMQGKNTFIKDLCGILQSTRADWAPVNKCRPKNLMDRPEPLIHKYNLKDWMSPTYSGGDIRKVCMPALQDSYRGIIRISKGVAVADAEAS